MQSMKVAAIFRVPKRRWRTPQALYWVVLLFFVAELAFWVLFRLVSLDEGWYLWAGKEVYRGRLLYRDFAYMQMPLLPYVYGLVQLVFGNGLYVGRIVTAVFGLIAGVLSAAMARRVAASGASALSASEGAEGAGLWAGVFTLIFLTTTFLAVTAFAGTATYALAASLLTAAFYLAVRLPPGGKRSVLVATFVSLAIAARLNVVVIFLPLGVYVILTSPKKVRTALELVATGMVVLGLLLGPFLLASGPLMPYDVLGFHVDRTMPEWRQDLVRVKLWETFRDLPVPFVAYLAAVAVLVIALLRGRLRRSAWRAYGFEVTVAATVFLLFLTHLIPRTATSYYNTLQVSLLAVLVGVMLSRLLQGRPRLAAALVLVMLAVQIATQAWVVRFQDLTTWPPQNQVEIVRQAAQALRRDLPARGQVLTFDLHLALEAGLDVPPGFEMSIFSYRPTWSTEQAQRYRVINNDMLLAALDQGVDAVALTQFDDDLLYGQRDKLFDSLYRNYRWARSVPGFDPFRNDLRIYLPPQRAMPPTATQFDRPLDHGIRLLGYELTGDELRPGEPLRFGLYWQAEQAPPDTYTVFTHLLNSDEAVVVGWDNPPCYGTCPTTTWRSGEVIRDEYVLEVPGSLAPGEYQLEAGMYDPATMKRLEMLDLRGGVIGDRAILATLTCQPDGDGGAVKCSVSRAAR